MYSARLERVMKKKLSIKEIAEIAGVSVATISRVMNQNGGYSAETEQKVWEVVKAHDFVPNLMAKGLRTNKTPMVGIIIPDIVNEFYSKLVLQLQMILFEAGYLTTICNTNESSELEQQHVQALFAQNVSGLILISGSSYNERAEYARVPTVYIDRRPQQWDKGIIYVESDNVQGGYEATKELLDCGCKRIAFMTDMLCESSKTYRYEGYCKALAEAEIPVDPSFVMRVEQVKIEAAKEVVTAALKRKMKFDGIMCTTDMLAIGSIIAIREAGLQIPRDIKITGFDDVSATTIMNPTVTTVHQHSNQMTEAVAEILIGLMEGEMIEKQRYCIPITLLKRESTRGK